MSEKWGLVAIPRRWCSDLTLNIIVTALGRRLPSIWPLRNLIHHELTAHEQDELLACETEELWLAKVKEIRGRLKW
jgi:hypothetical protein